MRKKENIVRYTAEQIRQMIARGEDKTDWKRVNAMSQAEVERLADEEDGPLPDGWEDTIIIGFPFKRDIHIRLDGDIIDWFKAHGRGYQTRINAVLRAFVQARTGTNSKPAIRSRTNPTGMSRTKRAN
jgi:uncharacterized protein (DUF4415 family)